MELPISETMKAYCEEHNIIFSDLDRATILWSSEISRMEKLAALRELAAETDDQTLKEQIEVRLSYEADIEREFQRNDNNVKLFVLFLDGSEWIEANFSDFETTFQWGMERAEKTFSLQKYNLIGKSVEYRDACGIIAHGRYDKAGTLRFIASAEIPDPFVRPHLSRFEYRFFPPLNPFERGDLVSWGRRLCVVDESQDEWKASCGQSSTSNRNFYFPNFLTVQFLHDDGHIAHHHISPFQLERVTTWEDQEALKLMTRLSLLIQDKYSIGFFLSEYDAYREKKRYGKKSKND